MLIEKVGDLFAAQTDAIGHGVNCKGLMGAGIAKTFRSKFPDMYMEYRKLCVEGLLLPGQIYPYRDVELHVTVINIASQEYPGPDANIEWLGQGVRAAFDYCEARGIKSLALPRIGCGIGGLEWAHVYPLLYTVAELRPNVELEIWSLT